jgi:anti-anti-sigma regulatory factor
MNIKLKVASGPSSPVTVMRLKGCLNRETARSFRQYVDGLPAGAQLLADISALTEVNRDTLRVLLHAFDITTKGGDFKLVDRKRVLETAVAEHPIYANVFEVYSNEADAIGSFTAAGRPGVAVLLSSSLRPQY